MDFRQHLLDAAKHFMDDLGVSIVPVGAVRRGTPGEPGKEALLPWKTPPSRDDVMHCITNDRRCTGIAGLLGPPTNLICRDFDDVGAFDSWRDRNPEVARELPLVAAARGGHVYTIDAGASTMKFDDGELRAAGAYVLVPPSRTVEPAPGRPERYIWLAPMPRSLDLIPRVDVRILMPEGHPCVRSDTAEPGEKAGRGRRAGRRRSKENPPQTPLSSHVSGGLGGIEITECILRSLPEGPGERHRRLWDLARMLRAVLPEGTSDAKLRRIADEWFRHARPVIRTQDVDETRDDLVNAWHDVALPPGWTWGRIVAMARADDWRPRLGSGGAARIARLLRAAGQAHGGRMFHLDYRRIADAVGITPQSAHAAARKVVEAGMVVIVDRGSPRVEEHRATVWQWHASHSIDDEE